MPKPLRVSAPAARELREAMAWYEAQVAGLGVRLIGEVDRALSEIAANPRLFATVHRDVRRALVRPFPYAIFFRELESAIRVIAVVHLHRDPATWQRRH